jgi:hypothetical protein
MGGVETRQCPVAYEMGLGGFCTVIHNVDETNPQIILLTYN